MVFEVKLPCIETRNSSCIPSAFKKYRISYAQASYTTGPFGDVLAQEISGDFYTCWYHQYFIKERTTLPHNNTTPILSLHFMLKGQLDIALPGTPPRTDHEGQFNLQYVPVATYDVQFAEGDYQSFNISFYPEYLEKLQCAYPVLEQLLARAQDNIGGAVNKCPCVIDTRVLTLIKSILQCEEPGEAQKIFLACKVNELLLYALKEVSAVSQVKETQLSQRDIAKIQAVNAYIMQNLDTHLTIPELGAKFCIAPTRLSSGFKQLYDTTIMRFILQQRMEKAMQALMEPGCYVGDIYLTVGYQNFSNFTRAFTGYFGHSPLHFRKSAATICSL
jgi:AraC-like DNA-binding protein